MMLMLYFNPFLPIKHPSDNYADKLNNKKNLCASQLERSIVLISCPVEQITSNELKLNITDVIHGSISHNPAAQLLQVRN